MQHAKTHVQSHNLKNTNIRKKKKLERKQQVILSLIIVISTKELLFNGYNKSEAMLKIYMYILFDFTNKKIESKEIVTH